MVFLNAFFFLICLLFLSVCQGQTGLRQSVVIKAGCEDEGGEVEAFVAETQAWSEESSSAI